MNNEEARKIVTDAFREGGNVSWYEEYEVHFDNTVEAWKFVPWWLENVAVDGPGTLERLLQGYFTYLHEHPLSGCDLTFYRDQFTIGCTAEEAFLIGTYFTRPFTFCEVDYDIHIAPGKIRVWSD